MPGASHVSLSHPNRMEKGRRVKVLWDTKKFRCTPTYFVGTILKDIASSPSSSSLFSSQQDESRRWQIEYDDGQMSTEDVSEKVSNAFPVGTRVRQYLNGTPGGNYGLFGVVVDWDGGEYYHVIFDLCGETKLVHGKKLVLSKNIFQKHVPVWVRELVNQNLLKYKFSDAAPYWTKS